MQLRTSVSRVSLISSSYPLCCFFMCILLQIYFLDLSPAGNDITSEDLNEMGNGYQHAHPQGELKLEDQKFFVDKFHELTICFYVVALGLLTESVCTVDTPHRRAPESSKRRFTSDSMEDDTLIPEDGPCSSGKLLCSVCDTSLYVLCCKNLA